MPTFDVSFLNKNLRKSSNQDYGFLVDQLSIKEDQLASDGKLSPGDYDLLTSEARKIYSHPGLTAAQRSGLEVKIAGYSKQKQVDTVNNSNDISELNRNVSDDMTKIVQNFSNDPQKFLQAQAALYSAKIDQLSTSIDSLEASGDDATNHQNELTNTLKSYNDTITALNDVSTYDHSGNSKSNYAAYLVTNSKGEIVDMKINRFGGQSGYMPTNGIYGGLPVYGKVNRSDNGKSSFQLGTQEFVESNNLSTTGPDGISSQKVLVAGGGGKGGIVVNGKNVDIDTTKISSQNGIPNGGYLQGSKGFIYQKNDDGSYKKYVNATPEQLNIQPGQIVKMPQSFEQGILGNVSETVDASAPINVPIPPPGSASTTTPSTIPPGGAGAAGDDMTKMQSAISAMGSGPISSQLPTPPKGRPNTGGAPVTRAPQSSQGIAGQALGKVTGFLGSIFG